MKTSLILFAFALASCQPLPSPKPILADADSGHDPEPTYGDASFVPPVGGACSIACGVLHFCGCPEGLATPKDRAAGLSDQQSCERWVANVNDFPGMALDCTAVAMCRDIACVRRVKGVRCGATR